MSAHVAAASRRLLTRPMATAFGTTAIAFAVVPAIAAGHLPMALSWVVLAFSAGYAISGSV
ncbi:MAG: hypothetical protein GEU94_13900 [Micromonosporaceae bacterium]|nr:hypothetical protein [Micromonosporaceae bacterium]